MFLSEVNTIPLFSVIIGSQYTEDAETYYVTAITNVREEYAINVEVAENIYWSRDISESRKWGCVRSGMLALAPIAPGERKM